MQLGQVLLYKIDNIKREDSNNLWMRDLHIRMNNKNNVDDKVCVKLEDNELIEMNQECWRCSNIKGTMGDFIINCKVTHKLGQKNYVCKN
ncbi:AvrD family protein [Vibrio gazogenes]|uniref:AvrD family protein n=1 Tax=Vibrio gazogenes TaxID=687 RepID=UPI0035A16E1B